MKTNSNPATIVMHNGHKIEIRLAMKVGNVPDAHTALIYKDTDLVGALFHVGTLEETITKAKTKCR